MPRRRLAPWIIAAVLSAAGSQGAHALAYWLESPASTSTADHEWMALLPAIVIAGGIALIAALAVETRAIIRDGSSSAVPSWIFMLPAAAFLVQEHLERAAATAAVPVDTLAQPAVLAGLALQLPFGLIALIATRLLQRATVATARRIRRRAHSHHALRTPWHDIADPRPPRVELLRPAGRGPPAFAVL